MVADGMGAHAAGELASKLAIDTVPLSYQKIVDRAAPDALLAAVEDANQQINQRGGSDPEFKGMGTTCTVLVLLPQGALAAQVGDSRAYRLRGNRFEQLTFDHSLVWELRASGQLPAGHIPDYIPEERHHAFAGAESARAGRYRGAFSGGRGRYLFALQ